MKYRPAAFLVLLSLAAFGSAASALPVKGTAAAATAAKAWLDDFERLLKHAAAVYANLEWGIAHYRIDPYQLAEETRARLAQADSQAAAVRAIQAFIEAFHDPHFRSKPLASFATRGSSAASAALPPPIRPTLSGAEVCQLLGVVPFKDPGFYYRLDLQAGYKAISRPAGTAFPAGVLSLGDGRRLGVLRIPTFDDDKYPAACARAWERYRATLQKECDADCQTDFLYKQIAAELLTDMRDTLLALQAAAMDALLIDISQNGGGNSWESPASRQLTALPLPELPGAFIRHSHWLKRLEAQRAMLQKDLDRKDLRPTDRQILEPVLREIERRLAEAAQPCDRTILWSLPGARLGCTQLVKTGSLSPRLPKDALAGLPSLSLLAGDAQYEYAEGTYRGPLFVLVDEWTASASESFVSRLQAGGAAKVIGIKTYGAGCGYTNGGVPIALPSLDLKVFMPDCVRYRADGENEILGLKPDFPLAWGKKEPQAERTAKLLAALAALPFSKRRNFRP